MIFKFNVVLVAGAWVAQARVAPSLAAGDVARVLRVGGLEVATPLAMGDRLGGCGILPGDRLAVFPSAPNAGDFPAPIRTGGREVSVRLNNRTVSSGGRPMLTIGVPDLSEPSLPDIDLREIALSSRVNLLPGKCAILLFDSQIDQWFASLAGGARVLIDDYELTKQPIPISAVHSLRFFTPLDDPFTQSPLAEIQVTLSAPAAASTQRLPVGPFVLTTRFGSEIGPYTLRASDNVKVGQVAAGIAKQSTVDLNESAQVARLRVAPPNVRVGDLLPGEQLYMQWKN